MTHLIVTNLLTPWSSVLLHKPIVAQLVNMSLHFKEPKGSVMAVSVP